MKSTSLRTAALALMEYNVPTTNDPEVLESYADALHEMANIAYEHDRLVTSGRYMAKANVLRFRAARARG